MKKLNTKQLRLAHELIAGFHLENKNMIFDVPSLLQYCLENDLRIKLKEKKFTDIQIDQILTKSNFRIYPKKKGTNKVKFNFIFKDYESFLKT